MNWVWNFPCHLSSLLPQEGTVLKPDFDFEDPEALSRYREELRISMEKLRIASANITRQVWLITRQGCQMELDERLPIMLWIADKTMWILALPCGTDNLEEIAA